MIQKKISVGSLDVDSDSGKIWLNSPDCILRIQNLKFNHVINKFAMIDINGNDAFMIPGDFGTNKYTEFLEKLNVMIFPKIFELDEKIQGKFLEELYLKNQLWIKEKEEKHDSTK